MTHALRKNTRRRAAKSGPNGRKSDELSREEIMKSTKLYRQGDVLLVPYSGLIEADATEVTDPRGVVLAEGETSGHYHGVFGGSKLFRFRNDMRVLRIDGDAAEVRVVGGEVNGTPRHTPIRVDAGNYRVVIQRTWSGELAAAQRVVD
jgi:hypothetical protein